MQRALATRASTAARATEARAKHGPGVSPVAIAKSGALLAVPALLILGLSWPMLFTGAAFNEDWLRHLWYVWNQSVSLRENHAPSLFLNYDYSVFYPVYAFYGGTLYALLGGLSLALGDQPIVAYVIGYLLGFAAAYGGWYWLARAAGIGRWQSQLPAAIFLTSGYYVTLVYARGDLQELVAVSMIPLMLASGLAVLRAERVRFWPALALAASSVVFFGSHSLTLLWASTLAAIVGCAVLVGVPQTRRWVTVWGVLRLAALMAPALLVSAWFLLPELVYQSHTVISALPVHWVQVLEAHMYMVSAANILSPLRPSALSSAGFVLALPVLAMAWALGCAAVYRRRGLRDAWLRMLLLCGALAALLTVLMTHAQVVLSLPHPYALLQYAYRLESYIILAVTGALVAGLVLAGKAGPRRRRWSWLLAAVALYSVVGAIAQTDGYPRIGDRSGVIGVHAPLQASALLDYLDVDLSKHPSGAGHHPRVVFPFDAVRGDRVSEVVHLRPHEIVNSNLAGWPQLVHLSGARIVGLGYETNDLLEIGAAKPGPTEVITVSAASPLPVVLGRWLSAIGALALLGTLIAIAIRRSGPIVRARPRRSR